MAERAQARVELLDLSAIEQMAGKIREAGARPEMSEKVRRWRDKHPAVPDDLDGFSFALVGDSLMYLHRAPDGMIVPHTWYADGTEKVYTDLPHAEMAYEGQA